MRGRTLVGPPSVSYAKQHSLPDAVTNSVQSCQQVKCGSPSVPGDYSDLLGVTFSMIVCISDQTSSQGKACSWGWVFRVYNAGV